MKNKILKLAMFSTIGGASIIGFASSAQSATLPNAPQIISLDSTSGDTLSNTKFSITEVTGGDSKDLGPFSSSDNYMNSIKNVTSNSSDCSDSPQKITFKQVSANTGYKNTDGTITLCKVSGGWLLDSIKTATSGSIALDDSSNIIYLNDEKTTNSSEPTSPSSESTAPTNTNSSTSSSTSSSTGGASSTSSPSNGVSSTSSATSPSGKSSSSTSKNSDNSAVTSTTTPTQPNSGGTTSTSTSSTSPKNSATVGVSTSNPKKSSESVMGPKVVTDFVGDNPMSSLIALGVLGGGAGTITAVKIKNKMKNK